MKKFLNRLALYSKEYTPTSFKCLKEGYSLPLFKNDLIAGITVGLVALPLAMALAIGSGVPPARGLFTAIIAGFIISLLGGTRVQIGGPTGAFVIIVFGIVQQHGYDGLAIATLIGGMLIILMGLTRCGVLLRFIPYPVTIGFTTGIAVIIFTCQVKDFFGMQLSDIPAEFLEKWSAYASVLHTCSICAIILAASTLGTIFLLRYFFPCFPGAILAVTLATLIASLLDLPVETIESRFGDLPSMLPVPSFPELSLERIQQVFPAAITIALLGGIETLQAALVADGLTGQRHRFNPELVAQGLANVGSVIFGGIPATGAISRTTINVKMGAKTPISGMVHAATLLLLMLVMSPLADKIPLATLSAVLMFGAWNMIEIRHFIEILRSELTDAIVLLITFLLTVLIDLTTAVQAGVILSAFLFLKKMGDATTVKACRILIADEAKRTSKKYDTDIVVRDDVPNDVLVFEMKGPFFFGVSDVLHETLKRVEKNPRVFILRMRHVPIIDTTGLQALKNFNLHCKNHNILFLITGLQPSVKVLFKKSKLDEIIGHDHIFHNLDSALDYARKHESGWIENQKLLLAYH